MVTQQPADLRSVSLDNEWERQWWCTQLRCSPVQLLDAARAVGTDVTQIRGYLQRRWQARGSQGFSGEIPTS